MRDTGRLQGPDVDYGGKPFAAGDEVVVKHNDRRLGVVNGETGTLTRIGHGTLTVELDRGTPVELPDSYAREGRLDHGYAATAHRAQGTTVDRAFVLGSDAIYREWGYTALSRHRDVARFYVTATPDFLNAAPEPLRDADLPRRVARMLEASRAEHLALHGVIQDELRPLLREQLEQAASHVSDIDAAIEQFRGQRTETRWYERGTRADIDRTLADHRMARERWQQQFDRLGAELIERSDPERPELWRARDPLARLDPAAELSREHARRRSLARDHRGVELGR